VLFFAGEVELRGGEGKARRGKVRRRGR